MPFIPMPFRYNLVLGVGKQDSFFFVSLSLSLSLCFNPRVLAAGAISGSYYSNLDT
jgi:hypothetical protein